ncbi:MAG: hypothetical protein JSU72_16760 [Deltaproteobacteria bacterium]|nr:MAG: hypothetical protein JSU72_16760 [Deltaproteobacteria bacterium]
MYNVKEEGRESLSHKLRRRTERLAGTERTVTGILDFSKQTTAEERSQWIDQTFYSCEFVGFLDSGETRVGCMLHPSAKGNGGVDWRGLSIHGTMACQGFFCRAFRELNSIEVGVILESINDWYLYGLVISDVDFAKVFFRMARERLGRLLDPAMLRSPLLLEVALEFFNWRIDWPHRGSTRDSDAGHSSERVQGKQDGLESRSPYHSNNTMDLLLQKLDSAFDSPAERQSAVMTIEQLFSRLTKDW